MYLNKMDSVLLNYIETVTGVSPVRELDKPEKRILSLPEGFTAGLYPSVLPMTLSSSERHFLGYWKGLLRRQAITNQEGISLYTGEKIKPKDIVDLHHAIFTANQAVTPDQKYYIQSSMNVIIVEHQLHIDKELKDRKQNILLLISLYGLERIKEYYEGFPSKVPIRSFESCLQ